MSRLIALAFAATSGCAPELGPGFAGEYDVPTPARWTCRHDHPDGAPYGVLAYIIEPLVIEEEDDGTLSLSLPMPPCKMTGEDVGDALELRADDCIVEYPASEWFEAGSISYDSGHGVGVWNDGQLELTTETGRRYTSVPDGLPKWWDGPGSCSATYVLARR